MGEQCPIKCTSFSLEWENTVPQWTFKFNSTQDAAETWHLKGHTLKVNIIDVCMHACIHTAIWMNIQKHFQKFSHSKEQEWQIGMAFCHCVP